MRHCSLLGSGVIRGLQAPRPLAYFRCVKVKGEQGARSLLLLLLKHFLSAKLVFHSIKWDRQQVSPEEEISPLGGPLLCFEDATRSTRAARMDSMGAGAARCSTHDITTSARDLVDPGLLLTDELSPCLYAVGIGLQARDQAQTFGTLAPSGLGQAMQVHLLPKPHYLSQNTNTHIYRSCYPQARTANTR